MTNPDTLQDLKDSRDIWVAKAQEWRSRGEKLKRNGGTERAIQECRDEYQYRMGKAASLNAQIAAMEAGE
jgi:hypothetical protein